MGSYQWPIIVSLCEIEKGDSDLDDYDDCDVDEIIQKYRIIINNTSESFEFISKIIGDYNEFNFEMKSKMRTKSFITENWQNYKDFFDFRNKNSEIDKTVICLTISKVIKCRKIIPEIKSKVRL